MAKMKRSRIRVFGVALSTFIGIAASVLGAVAAGLTIWSFWGPRPAAFTDVEVYSPATLTAHDKTLALTDDALSCAMTSIESARNDAHLCDFNGWILDPCFDAGAGYVQCPGGVDTKAGDGMLFKIGPYQKFYFDRPGANPYTIDTAQTQKYPWALVLSPSSGGTIYCELAFATPDIALTNASYTCAPVQVPPIYLAGDSAGFVSGTDRNITVMNAHGYQTGIALDRSGKLWTLRIVLPGEQSYTSVPVSQAWF